MPGKCHDFPLISAPFLSLSKCICDTLRPHELPRPLLLLSPSARRQKLCHTQQSKQNLCNFSVSFFFGIVFRCKFITTFATRCFYLWAGLFICHVKFTLPTHTQKHTHTQIHTHREGSNLFCLHSAFIIFRLAAKLSSLFAAWKCLAHNFRIFAFSRLTISHFHFNAHQQQQQLELNVENIFKIFPKALLARIAMTFAIFRTFCILLNCLSHVSRGQRAGQQDKKREKAHGL